MSEQEIIDCDGRDGRYTCGRAGQHAPHKMRKVLYSENYFEKHDDGSLGIFRTRHWYVFEPVDEARQ